MNDFFVSNQWAIPFWLLLTPIGSAAILVWLLWIAFEFHVRPVKPGIVVRMILNFGVFLFSAHLVFNVHDFVRYSRYGTVLSPFNRIYALFYTPPDRYEPLIRIPLHHGCCTYEANFCHRYCGPHDVYLNVVNNSPKEFIYGDPDRIDLSFDVHCSNRVENTLLVSQKVDQKAVYLTKGTNSLAVIEYEFQDIDKLSHKCSIGIAIKGGLESFLKRYPGSWFEIRNSFHL